LAAVAALLAARLFQRSAREMRSRRPEPETDPAATEAAM
jgi:hypothetical protein